MKRTIVLPTELSYLLGILLLAFGTAFMERADFGMSMVVAPAYILHRKLSQTIAFVTFGVAEYAFQAFLLLLLSLYQKKGKRGYLFSFLTAVVYGVTLDAAIALVSSVAAATILLRLLWYAVGMVLCSLGVALFFRSYIAPEAYELFVKEVSQKTGAPIGRVKTMYDCASCLLGIVLSFAFFGWGHFEGVKAGTVFCALVNGFLIGRLDAFLSCHCTFQDRLPLRRFFE